MPIIVNLDVMMARRKISLNELSEKVDITPANLSILKTGRQKPFGSVRLKPYVKFLIVSRLIYSNLKTKINLSCHCKKKEKRTSNPKFAFLDY